MARRATIVGVDPGTTAGWAVIDLDGNPVSTGSAREAGLSTILENVVTHGTPVIVATDVSPAPETVEKVAASVKAELWVPDESLSVDEKRELAADLTENDHERDALAAALKAHVSHERLFDKVEKRTPDDLDTDDVKRKVLRGVSIANAVRELSRDEEPGDEEPAGEPERKVEEETLLTRQARTITRLRERLKTAEQKLSEKDRELEATKRRLKDARTEREREALKSREVRRLKRENDNLRDKLDRERHRTSRLSRRLNESERSRLIEQKGMGRVAYRLPDLTRGEAASVAEAFDIEDHPVYVDSGSGAGKSGVDVVHRSGAEAVIVKESLPHHAEERLYEHSIPLIDASDLSVRKRDSFVILDEEEYREALEAAETRLSERKDRELVGLLREVADEMSG